MIAGLGLMVICSRKFRDTQLGGSLGLQSPKVLTTKLQPPRYDEVVNIDDLGSEDDTGLPSYWQASKGDTLQR